DEFGMLARWAEGRSCISDILSQIDIALDRFVPRKYDSHVSHRKALPSRKDKGGPFSFFRFCDKRIAENRLSGC
ncbi:MAG: hypothetical protein KGZ93_02845, partial [Actinobacteria bacterium]|nr:hypothetical protein [Actinomycetota bacterium]